MSETNGAAQENVRYWRDVAPAEDGGGYDNDAAESLGAPAAPKRFDLIPFRDITFSEGTRWLVKGLLPATGLATIFGPPKQYKSFIAADVALHVAAGEAWAGRRVRQGAVVYVVGEGQSGFSDRIAANRQKREYPDDLPFYLVKARPNLGVGEGDRGALVAAIEAVIGPLGISLAALVIDTLVRTLAGSSENDEGMRNFTDNAEALADHFDCLCLAVHHTGKDATKGMRGSSALHGAVVSSWRVEKEKPFQARITLEDAKDGESGLTWTADLDRHVHGIDEDGEEESVLIVSRVGEPVAEGHALPTLAGSEAPAAVPPQLKLFMACFGTAMAASSREDRPFQDGPLVRVVPLEAVRAEYYARRGDEVAADAKRKSFNNSLKTGLERRLLLVETSSGEKVIWRSDAAPRPAPGA